MRTATAIAAGCCLVFLFGCTDEETNYRLAAQQVIESEDVTELFGQSMTNIDCEQPPSTAVGTKFSCTARGEQDGKTYKFNAEIDASKRVAVDAEATVVDG